MSEIGLKDQCFGVEVEFTGITREQAASALAEHFGTIPRHGNDYYDSWYVRDEEGKEWKFMYDGSIRTECKGDSEYESINNSQYADALTNVADALEPQQKLMDAILCYVGEQYDSSELYNILHDTLAMSDQDIVSLGFDLPQCHKHNEEISTKRPKERKSTSYER